MGLGGTVADDDLAITDDLNRDLKVPNIKTIWLPEPRENPDKSDEFNPVFLDDDSVGLMFVVLEDTLQQIHDRALYESLSGIPAATRARAFGAAALVEKAPALGARG